MKRELDRISKRWPNYLGSQLLFTEPCKSSAVCQRLLEQDMRLQL
jgi:hypothetical protein